MGVFKKLVVISDTHSSLQKDMILPQKILDELDNADYLIHCGDFVSYSYYNYLLSLNKQFFGIHGNMDDYVLKQELPDRRILNIDNVNIGIFHGWGAPDKLNFRIMKEIFYTEKIDLLLYGHSHIPLIQELPGVKTVNPGSLRCNYTGKYSSTFAIVEIGPNKTILSEIVPLI